jgi:small subunit ribosomal protein S17
MEGRIMEATTRKEKQTLQGVVVSDKMQKTIVVEIMMRKLHPLYKKYLTRTKKVKAHDENNEAKTGDTVRVVECRPLSRDKRWRLAEIVERAK